MKYVVVAGENYYPSVGIGDWKGVFDDYEDAQAKARSLTDPWVRIITITADGEYWEEVWR